MNVIQELYRHLEYWRDVGKKDFPFKMLLYKRMSLDNDNKIK